MPTTSTHTASDVQGVFDDASDEIVSAISETAPGVVIDEIMEELPGYAAELTGGLPSDRPLSLEEVSEHVNHAADAAVDGLPDEGLRDAVNLLVNAGLHRLQHGADVTLAEIVEASYEEDLPTVLDWATR